MFGLFRGRAAKEPPPARDEDAEPAAGPGRSSLRADGSLTWPVLEIGDVRVGHFVFEIDRTGWPVGDFLTLTAPAPGPAGSFELSNGAYVVRVPDRGWKVVRISRKGLDLGAYHQRYVVAALSGHDRMALTRRRARHAAGQGSLPP